MQTEAIELCASSGGCSVADIATLTDSAQRKKPCRSSTSSAYVLYHVTDLTPHADRNQDIAQHIKKEVSRTAAMCCQRC